MTDIQFAGTVISFLTTDKKRRTIHPVMPRTYELGKLYAEQKIKYIDVYPPGGPNEPPPATTDWPIAPYTKLAFTDNNYDGESDYGQRTLGKGWHDGIDFAMHDAYSGSNIRAIGPGTVIDISWYNWGEWGGPYLVGIEHDTLNTGSLSGKKLISVYAHMNYRNVSVGQRVTSETVVGTMGALGQVTGPHLHLEIHIDEIYQYGDPGIGGSQDPVPIFDEYGGWR